MEVGIVVMLFFGLIGCMAANIRGWNPVIGFIGGCLLGPFAFLLFFVSGVVKRPAPSQPMKVCGQCAEQVQPAAKVCRFCGHKFDW